MQKKIIVFMALCFGILFQTSDGWSKMALPQPPLENPHPPVTEADKKRVSFAENVVRQLLMKDYPPVVYGKPPSPPPTVFFLDKDLLCLQTPSCWQKDYFFVSEVAGLKQQYGTLEEIRFAHVIPWAFEQFQAGKKAEQLIKKDMAATLMPAPVLKSDEYMIHIYAKWSGRWHHLDVIVTENAKGEIFLRHFFSTPMPLDDSQLPPGVKC